MLARCSRIRYFSIGDAREAKALCLQFINVATRPKVQSDSPRAGMPVSRDWDVGLRLGGRRRMEESIFAQPEWLPSLFRTGPAEGLTRRLPRVAVDLAARLVSARRSSLLLPSEERNVLCVAASNGLGDLLAEHVRVRVGDPIAGAVAATRQPVIVNERKVKPGQRTRGYVTGSYMSLPVPLDDHSCGVLSVADPLHGDGFHNDDLHALEGFVQHVSTSLSFQVMSQQAASLEQTVHRLRRQVVQVQESERQRIARDLHDEAGHALTAAILRLDVQIAQRSDDMAALATLHSAREELVECAKSLHEIAFNLRPRILEDFGMHAAIRSLARYTMGVSDLDVTVEIDGDQWKLGELEELAILRVTQEALTNTRKYAHASSASVTLHYERNYVTLHIQDDGIGIGAQVTRQDREDSRVAMGIAGMRERIELLGGRFWIGPGPNGGTLVSALLPH